MANYDMDKLVLAGFNGEHVDDTFTMEGVKIDNTLSVAGRAADAKKTGDEIDALKEDLGDFIFSQNKAARVMSIPVSCSSGDIIYIKLLEWTGDSWSNFSIQGYDGSSYSSTLVALHAVGEEKFYTASSSFESLMVSINVASVPASNVRLSCIVCNVSSMQSISQYVLMNKYAFENGSFKFRGYVSANGNINTITNAGWYLIASTRIEGTTGLPAGISADSVLTVYPGNLTVQTIQELGGPHRYFQRYLYSNNTMQSAWITKGYNSNIRTAYLFGDSLGKGTLGGGGGTGTSYLQLALIFAGFNVVNCSVGGIGYVYSGKKLVSEVPWNTGEGRIRAQDVINHYASELVNADTVVLAFGVNDWQTLGDTSVTIAEADRRATSANITANLKTAIETIVNAHKGCRIVVVTPVNTSYRGGSVASGWALETALTNNNDGREAMTLEKVYQAIVDACEYYGVEYIDMTHNNAAVNYLNINDVLPDKLHPTQTTYNRLAESIKF